MTDDTLLYVFERVIPAAYALLPGRMASPQATALLLAIGLQESGFEARRQKGDGPARGFWQFERGGVKGVLEHPLTRLPAEHACAVLAVFPSVEIVHPAIEYGDVLAAAVARLYLWTAPAALPEAHEPGKGWGQYVATWRPGKPREAAWQGNWDEAWRLVSGD